MPCKKTFWILPHILDDNQGVFMKHKGVVPTTLIGLELIHQVIHVSKPIKHMANIAIKLDLSKAFDRIE